MKEKFLIILYLDRKEKDFAPRISYKLVEYVWNFIKEKFLIPNKIWINDKYNYRFALWLERIKPEHKYFQENSFNTEDTKIFTPKFRNSANSVRQTILNITSRFIDKNISPSQCALLLYDAFASLILIYTKKLSKEDFDREKENLDFDLINSFPFPATLEETQYQIVDI